MYKNELKELSIQFIVNTHRATIYTGIQLYTRNN